MYINFSFIVLFLITPVMNPDAFSFNMKHSHLGRFLQSIKQSLMTANLLGGQRMNQIAIELYLTEEVIIFNINLASQIPGIQYIYFLFNLNQKKTLLPQNCNPNNILKYFFFYPLLCNTRHNNQVLKVLVLYLLIKQQNMPYKL